MITASVTSWSKVASPHHETSRLAQMAREEVGLVNIMRRFLFARRLISPFYIKADSMRTCCTTSPVFMKFMEKCVKGPINIFGRQSWSSSRISSAEGCDLKVVLSRKPQNDTVKWVYTFYSYLFLGIIFCKVPLFV